MSIDTSPKRLRELADKDLRKWMAPSDLSNVLLALAAEKETPGPVCPTCGSDCNERDELEKAEREIERLRAEIRQRERMNARFANRAPSPPTADFDLPHESDDAAGHAEQPIEMAKPADMPLPEPALASVVTELFSTSPYYTADQMRQYGQACAKAARDAAFDECVRIAKAARSKIWSFYSREVREASENVCDAIAKALKEAKKGTT